VRRGQAGQDHGRDVRTHTPEGLELWTTCKHSQDGDGWPLIDEQREKFQSRGIDPVQVFHKKQDGLPRCFCE